MRQGSTLRRLRATDPSVSAYISDGSRSFVVIYIGREGEVEAESEGRGTVDVCR